MEGRRGSKTVQIRERTLLFEKEHDDRWIHRRGVWIYAIHTTVLKYERAVLDSFDVFVTVNMVATCSTP